MTEERDFDRLARAWLELGPDLAPERTVAAVLQAVEITPQVRSWSRWLPGRNLQMNRLPIIATAVVTLVVVIGGVLLFSQENQPATGGPGTSPSVVPSSSVVPSPSLDVSPSAPAASAQGIVLQRAPTNLGCDSLPVGYRSATIHIDPESDIVLEVANPAYDGTKDKVNVDVWAEIDDTAGGGEPQVVGTRLAVYWTAGFNATDGATPVIRGPAGEEVARNGTKIDGEFTKLTGYFTCLSRDAIYILEYTPG